MDQQHSDRKLGFMRFRRAGAVRRSDDSSPASPERHAQELKSFLGALDESQHESSRLTEILENFWRANAETFTEKAQVAGLSVDEYLNREKLAEAKRILKANGISLPEVNLNGPCGIDGFRFEEREYRGLTKRPHLLLSHLWDAPDRTADFDELAEPVWDDAVAVPSSTAVGSACRQVNRFFKKHKLPFRIAVSGRRVTLREDR